MNAQEDYQYTADWYAEQFNKLSEVFRDKESEETEVNKMDKEKLLDLLDRQTFAYHEMQPESPEDYTAEYKKGYNEGLKFAIAYIDQLDEVDEFDRVLLKHIKDIYNQYEYDYLPGFINDIKDGLAKMNEPEKPVIPDYVADYLDFAKSDVSLMRVMELANTRNEWPKWEKEYDWISANDEKFARAWLDGYTVEEEQKYILSISITDEASKTNYETFLNKRGIFHSIENESFNSEEFNWTEEEIKDLENGEILFEHFATKVGELE